MKTSLIIVIGMALVTYIPRMLPLVVLPGIELPTFIRSFLSFIPIAVLSALIFPGFIDSTGNPFTAVIGLLTAFILAYKKVNLMLVVLGAVTAVFISGLMF